MDTSTTLSISAALLSPFLLWLMFCLIVMWHYDDPKDAQRIIGAAGRWFPMRVRGASAIEPQTTEPAPELGSGPSGVVASGGGSSGSSGEGSHQAA